MKRKIKFFITFLIMMALCFVVTLLQKNTVLANEEQNNESENKTSENLSDPTTTVASQSNNSTTIEKNLPTPSSSAKKEVSGTTFFNKPTESSNVAKPPKTKDNSTRLYMAIQDEEGDEVDDELTFELKSDVETVVAKNDAGQIDAKLYDNVSYTVKLLENPNYIMEPLKFTLKKHSPLRDDNGDLIFNFDLKKKTAKSDEATEPKANEVKTSEPSEEPKTETSNAESKNEENTPNEPKVDTPKEATEETTKPKNESEKTTANPIRSLFLFLFDQDENEINDNLSFEFKSKDEAFTAESNDGEVGGKFKENTSYSVTLKENPTYTLKPLSFTIKEGTPYRDDNNDLLLSIDLVKHVTPIPKPKDDIVTPTPNKENESTNPKDEMSTPKENEPTTPATPKEETPLPKEDAKPTPNEKPNKPSYRRLYLAVLEGKEESEEDLTFEFSHGDEKIISKNDAGQVGARLQDNVSYNVKLLNNDKYNFDSFNFTIKDGIPYRDSDNDQIVSLDVYKKGEKPIPAKPEAPEVKPAPKPADPEDCGCDDPNQQKVTIKQLKIVDIKNPEGDTIKEPLTFVFFNVSKQKPAGEYTSKDGKLPRVEMLVDDEYEVYLKDNDKYGMRHRHFYAFLNHYPIDMDDEYERYTDVLEVIKKDKDYIEPKQPAVRAVMQVRYNGKIVKDPVTFEFISNGETLQATSVDGVVTVNLRESVDYMVGVINNDKYSIETFPIVIKNKQIGKFPYDHRTCWLVEYLDLVDKGASATENPHYTIATKDEKVRISGMDFKDLKLEVNKVDATTIPALEGKDSLVYEINFINIYRKEVVKLKGDFTVTVPKERGRKVKEIYRINEFGQLEKRESIPGEFNSVITFKTDSFSRFALVYEDKEQPKVEKETKPSEPAEKPKTDEKPTTPAEKPTEPKADTPSVKPSEPKVDEVKPTQPAEQPKTDEKPAAPTEQPKADEKPTVSAEQPTEPKVDTPSVKPSEPKVNEVKPTVPAEHPAEPKADTPSAKPTQPAEPKVVLQSNNNDISVTLKTNEKDLKLVTKEITDQKELDKLKENIIANDDNFKNKEDIANIRLLDLTLAKKDEKYSTDEPRTVRVALLEQEKANEVFLYHVAENGDLTPLTKEKNNLKVENGVLEFTINHFSKFTIVAKKSSNNTTPILSSATSNNLNSTFDKTHSIKNTSKAKKGNEQNNVKVEKQTTLPKTASSTSTTAFVGILVLLSALGFRKKQR